MMSLFLHNLRTIFEVDIDGFEEKPWKLPGIDVSDFFNFGLNEDSWRDYCKQLVGSFSSLYFCFLFSTWRVDMDVSLLVILRLWQLK